MTKQSRILPRLLEKRLMFDASLPAITGLVLWLDANDTATIRDAEGDNAASGAAFSGAVQTWADKSTSGFDVTALAATNRPGYSVGALGGKNVLTFDGSTDWLGNAGAVIGGDDYTSFIVFNRTIAGGRDAAFEMGTGASRNAIFLNEPSSGGSGKINMYHNGGWNNPSPTYTTSAYALFSSTVNTNAFTLAQDGAVVGTGTTGSVRATTTGIFVGNDSSGGDELQGNIAEILVFDRDLTADERHDIETYLAGKWNLTITNTAPVIATNTGVTVNEGALVTITNAMLAATDADNTESRLVYTVTNAVDHGTLFRDGNSNNIVDVGEAIVLNGIFRQSDLDSGLIKYLHNGSENFTEGFTFTTSDQRTATTAANFTITVTAVNDAPQFIGWNLISTEDFEGGTAAGWNNNLVTNGGTTFTQHLGRFTIDTGAQSIFKTYSLNATQDFTVIEFDFYRIDSWDNEDFRIFINDTQIFSQAFAQPSTTIADGSSGIVSWVVTERSTVTGNLGYSGGFNDQMFRFTMTINNALASTIKLGFGAFTSNPFQPFTDEAWGVDNIRVYEARTGGTPGPYSLAENTVNGQVVGSVSAADAEGHTRTFSITGGTGQSYFAINASTGAITVTNSTALDYEALGVGSKFFTLDVRVTDNGTPNAFTTQTITINILDLAENTAPSFTASGPFTIAENVANNTLVGTATATDAEGHTITYSITAGNTNELFTINASNGQIRINNNATLDSETQSVHTLTVRAQDNGFSTLFTDTTITINVSNINEAPVFNPVQTVLTTNPLVFYNAQTGNFYRFFNTNTTLATATANAAAFTLMGAAGHLATITSAAENALIDALANGNQIWLPISDSAVEGQWRWTAGPENGQMFWLGAGSGAGGAVQPGFYANWNGTNEPNNSGGNEDFAFFQANGTWNDMNGGGNNRYIVEWEGSAVFAAMGANPNVTINENTTNGTVITTAQASDRDAGDTITYSITGGTGAGFFNINPTNGQMTVSNASGLDFENSATLTVNLRVQDAGGLFATRTLTVTLNDVNEAPSLTSAGPFSVDENASNTTLVTNLTGIDPDVGNTFTYSITGGSGAGAFTLNPLTGVLRVANSVLLDFEATPSLSLNVRVMDTLGLFTVQTILINLRDLQDTTAAGSTTTPDPFIPPPLHAANVMSGLGFGPRAETVTQASLAGAGSLIHGMVDGGDAGLQSAVYGPGQFTQIIRDNIVMPFDDGDASSLEAVIADQGSEQSESMPVLSANASSPTVTADSASDVTATAPLINDRLMNLRLALEAQDRANAHHSAQAGAHLLGAGGDDPSIHSLVHPAFSDVMTYHLTRQAELRKALAS